MSNRYSRIRSLVRRPKVCKIPPVLPPDDDIEWDAELDPDFVDFEWPDYEDVDISMAVSRPDLPDTAECEAEIITVHNISGYTIVLNDQLWYWMAVSGEMDPGTYFVDVNFKWADGENKNLVLRVTFEEEEEPPED